MSPKRSKTDEQKSDVEVSSATEEIERILSNLSFAQVEEVRDWLDSYMETAPSKKSAREEELKKKKLEKQTNKLEKIATYFREKGVDVPSKELCKLKYPTEGFDSDCTELNTCEIDSFLYDDDDIDQLVEHGQLSRTYCTKCKSRETVPLNFISHSLSRMQVQFVFDKLMPDTVTNVLDIGSRLGTVLYGASIFTEGKVKAVGVEMDPNYIALTAETVKKFGLKNIQLVNDDIRNLPDVFKDNQLIVMNNVFSFFLSIDEQVECWEFLHKHMRPGTILIHHPMIEKSLGHLKLSFEVEDWLEWVDASHECLDYGGTDVEIYEEMETMVKYIIKEPESKE